MNKDILIKKIVTTDFSKFSEEKLAELWYIIQQTEEGKSHCPECNSTKLANFSSFQIKICTTCGVQIPWKLKEGQQPLVKYQR